MTAYQILLLLLVILIIVYLAVLFYASSKISYFRSSIKGRMRALAIVFSQRKEVLLALADLYQKTGAGFGEEDASAISRARWLLADVKNAGEAEGANEILSRLEKRLDYLAATNSVLLENEEARLLKATLGELEFNYRRVLAGYNSDVLGYNYWRALWPCRFVYFLIRLPYLKQMA